MPHLLFPAPAGVIGVVIYDDLFSYSFPRIRGASTLFFVWHSYNRFKVFLYENHPPVLGKPVLFQNQAGGLF